jgi:hypothetical protein
MKTIEQCLDIILRQLLKNWDKPNNARDNLNSKDLLSQFGLSDTMQKDEFFKRLIFRLVKDGYVEFNTHLTMDRNSPLEQFQNYPLITIEGYYFITKKDGGYENKSNHDETFRELRDNRDKRLSNGTIYLAIGTFLLVIVEALIHRHELLSLFSCY